jgi:hypothetical protein
VVRSPMRCHSATRNQLLADSGQRESQSLESFCLFYLQNHFYRIPPLPLAAEPLTGKQLAEAFGRSWGRRRSTARTEPFFEYLPILPKP